MYYIYVTLSIILIYVILAKLFPYFAFPNFYRKSKIERYKGIQKLALKLKRKNKIQTIKNTYQYMIKTYQGRNQLFHIKNMLTILKIGDFSTIKILHKKQFLWCFNQNKLLKSILVNTKQFKEDEIIIESRFHHVFIHQWITIKSKNKKFILDPYYQEFELVQIKN